MDTENKNYVKIINYNGALGDIAYFDCINSAISKMISERHPEKVSSFISPIFPIQKVMFPSAFENHNLSADEYLHRDSIACSDYYPYTGIYDPTDNSNVKEPPIENGYRTAIRQIYACDIAGSKNVISARTSYLLKKYLLSEEGKEYDIALFNILIRTQIKSDEAKKALPVNAKITDQSQSNMATFSMSIKSTIEKLHKNNTVNEEEYEYVMNLIEKFETLAKYEYAPVMFTYGSRSVLIQYYVNIDNDDIRNIVYEYLNGILSVYNSLEKESVTRFPILCKELLSHI